MAITFDAGSTGQADGSGAASLTIAHTVGGGANRALVVLVHSIAADKLSAATVTYGGVSMGSPVLAHAGSFCYAWVLAAPASGTANVVITFNSGGTYANAVVASFAGVDQTTPVSATPTPYDNGFATSPRSLSITIPTDGAGLDLLFASNASTTLTPTASGQTAIGATLVNTGVWSTRCSYLLGAASSMDWTFTGSGFQATHAALALAPATASGPTITTQPSNQTVTAPATATFTCAATGTGGLTYQWQRQPSGGGGYSNISGATGAGYTTGSTSVTGGSHNNGDTYRCNVTDTLGTTATNPATLTVNAPAVTFTSDPLYDGAGLLVNQALAHYAIYNDTTGALVLRVTGISTNSSGQVVISNVALSAATMYRHDWETSDGKRRMPRKATP